MVRSPKSFSFKINFICNRLGLRAYIEMDDTEKENNQNESTDGSLLNQSRIRTEAETLISH